LAFSLFWDVARRTLVFIYWCFQELTSEDETDTFFFETLERKYRTTPRKVSKSEDIDCTAAKALRLASYDSGKECSTGSWIFGFVTSLCSSLGGVGGGGGVDIPDHPL